MRTPEDRKGGGPNFAAHWFVYDYAVCFSMDELRQALENINYHGFDIVAVTETNTKYTIFFKRLAP